MDKRFQVQMEEGGDGCIMECYPNKICFLATI